jgi:hypothetical protein
MKTSSLTCLLSIALVGCSSSMGESNPARIAPTPNDWTVAFTRLSQEDQAIIRSRPVLLGLAGTGLEGSIYHMTGRGITQELITTERLDMNAVCDGFNRAFGASSGNRWMVVRARTYEQVGAPSGMQKHRFELDWTFLDSIGKTISLSVMDFGPGVKITWGASRQAIDAEMNQAFALTFLELVAQLKSEPHKPTSM